MIGIQPNCFLTRLETSLEDLYKYNRKVCHQLYSKAVQADVYFIDRTFCAFTWVVFKGSETLVCIILRVLSCIPVYLRKVCSSSPLMQLCESSQENLTQLRRIVEVSSLEINGFVQKVDSLKKPIDTLGEFYTYKLKKALILSDVLEVLKLPKGTPVTDITRKKEPLVTIHDHKNKLNAAQNAQQELMLLLKEYETEKEIVRKMLAEYEKSSEEISKLQDEERGIIQECQKIFKTLKVG